jgi:hypothetical protein
MRPLCIRRLGLGLVDPPESFWMLDHRPDPRRHGAHGDRDQRRGPRRGHIPLALNSAVGGVFGSLVQNNRLIDNDPFRVSVFGDALVTVDLSEIEK